MKTKFFLLLFTLLIFPFSASALVFSNFSVGGIAGSVNTANGYFDDDASFFGYMGQLRNVYVVTELTGIFIFEPISRSSGISGDLKVINSTRGTLRDAVVHDGFLYFIDGTTLYKKKTRNDGSLCEATDTGVNGCIQTIATSIGGIVLRVYNNELYYFGTTSSLKKLDSNDNPITVMNVEIPMSAQAYHQSLAVTTRDGVVTAYYDGRIDGDTPRLLRGNSTSPTTAIFTSTGNEGSQWLTLFATATYIYEYSFTTNFKHDRLYFISNDTSINVDYATSDVQTSNRVYVGSLSTIGLVSNGASGTYETVNVIEAGVDSLPQGSEGSGVVTYTNKEIDVPNVNYYNDSVIPINIALRFIISDANKTNFTDTVFWHVKINDPLGIQVFDLNLPGIACTQQTPWWDVLGIFTSADWACDGSGSIEYTRTPGQFWTNGTYEVFLTEQLPGDTFILDSDTWNIVNQTSNNPGTVIQPPPCPTCGVTSPGTITITTAITILNVLGYVAFWGFVLWLGIIGLTIRQMTAGGGSVNGVALTVVAWLSAVFIALVGMFDPFKIYIIILSTIIAAILFRIGSNATTGDDN